MATELTVFKDILVLFVADLMEIIHVELPDKRREISMSKIDRKDLLLKSINVKDCEVGSIFIPGSNL